MFKFTIACMHEIFRLYIFYFFTVVDCGALINPANGLVSHSGTTFGQAATYSCNTGYNLVGNNTRTCQATRMWTGSVPTCQGRLLVHHNLCMPIHSGGMSFSVYLSGQIRRDSIPSTWLISTKKHTTSGKDITVHTGPYAWFHHRLG